MTDDRADLARLRRMVADLETRLDTIEAVLRSTVNATVEDTPEGREARAALAAVTAQRRRLAALAEIAAALGGGGADDGAAS